MDVRRISNWFDFISSVSGWLIGVHPPEVRSKMWRRLLELDRWAIARCRVQMLAVVETVEKPADRGRVSVGSAPVARGAPMPARRGPRIGAIVALLKSCPSRRIGGLPFLVVLLPRKATSRCEGAVPMGGAARRAVFPCRCMRPGKYLQERLCVAARPARGRGGSRCHAFPILPTDRLSVRISR